MAAIFVNAIKGTTAGTPGTGAFTPNAASSGFLAWSTVYTGWMGLVRYEDGSAWELSYGYWNATTISRPAAGFVASSTGSQLTLTSSATAALIVDACEVQPQVGMAKIGYWSAIPGGTTGTTNATGTASASGTATAATPADTNLLTEQIRVQYVSATTANALCGLNFASWFVSTSTTARRGSWDFRVRFGPDQLPTGPRLFVGMTNTAFAGTAEPSASGGGVYAVFGKDSTDTNIQLLVNSAGAGTKTDTGIPLAANGWYDAALWTKPGSSTVYGRLLRLDTGDIYYGSTSTDVPGAGNLLFPNVRASLNGTNTGTALNLNIATVSVRTSI